MNTDASIVPVEHIEIPPAAWCSRCACLLPPAPDSDRGAIAPAAEPPLCPRCIATGERRAPERESLRRLVLAGSLMARLIELERLPSGLPACWDEAVAALRRSMGHGA